MQSGDPYFLYGASNLGSFAALIAYPLIVEPFLPLKTQSWLWSSGFVLLMMLVAFCGLLMLRTMRPVVAHERVEDDSAPLTVATRLSWVGLPFVPSALLVAVTAHISTDIAAAPFLWVVPLALFLLTFVLTFRAGGETVHRVLVRIQPYVMAPLVSD